MGLSAPRTPHQILRAASTCGFYITPGYLLRMPAIRARTPAPPDLHAGFGQHRRGPRSVSAGSNREPHRHRPPLRPSEPMPTAHGQRRRLTQPPPSLVPLYQQHVFASMSNDCAVPRRQARPTHRDQSAEVSSRPPSKDRTPLALRQRPWLWGRLSEGGASARG